MRPPVCVVGPSDSGKTTLIESLVAALESAGRVGTIKSIHHDIEIDTPGKDTHRHRTAGADTVVGLTPSLSFEITPGGKDAADSERALLEATVSDLQDAGYEFVLIEGFHDAPYPKVVLGDREGIEPPVVARGSLEEFDVEALASSIVDETLFDDR
ncbi:molybdopterin-guanine dinucleotide biosynthesis protein B [Halonotius terrestris]|uniref:Molybdopterin-guanine dinucleotide biosynthesis protein B n=1 Tax=Halonotius terrestris TaxID=2487750 RepID=A0A8J8P9G7_9EURY|nr:molybdopterin-guanine dinucleotide biosynthesis protein B [Halonotius terrestris]TQQ80971.1 molybdopterin-guanine dinucleotide biosynthesis protein B [Halonotius terrestris]